MNSRDKTVLIVEDEQVLREVYTLVLQTKGYTVISAINGLEGLNRAKQSKPSVILLDVMMPIMDGKELMRNIDLSDYPGTKVIVYSNLSDRALEEEMIKLGASKFVLKSSMTPSELIEMVEES